MQPNTYSEYPTQRYNHYSLKVEPADLVVLCIFAAVIAFYIDRKYPRAK
jgi:hypothetical protein